MRSHSHTGVSALVERPVSLPSTRLFVIRPNLLPLSSSTIGTMNRSGQTCVGGSWKQLSMLFVITSRSTSDLHSVQR